MWHSGMGEKKYVEMVWFGHMERKKSEEFVKKVYVRETEGPRRGKPVVKWKDRVKEYMHEGVADSEEGIEQARRECEGEVEDFLPWLSP